MPIPPTPPACLSAAPPCPSAPTSRVWLLAGAAALALAVLASTSLLALHLFFESGDRERLHAHLLQANALLTQVDDAAALSALPARLNARFADEPELAVRVQGAHGQPLYEQGAHVTMPAALLAQPRFAPPAPLVSWREDQHAWRGSALIMRMPLDGAAPVTVAVALNVQRQHAFFTSLAAMLLGGTALSWLALAGMAMWASGRVTRLASE